MTQDPPQEAEARQWFTAAAQGGHVDAQYNLGTFLMSADPPQPQEARRWLTAAAEAGHSDAQERLGVLLMTQDPPQPAEARRWLTAAAQEDADAGGAQGGEVLADGAGVDVGPSAAVDPFAGGGAAGGGVGGGSLGAAAAVFNVGGAGAVQVAGLRMVHSRVTRACSRACPRPGGGPARPR